MKPLSSPNIGAISKTHVVIDLPNSEILWVKSRQLFFAAVIVILPCIMSIMRDSSRHNFGDMEFGMGTSTISIEFMDILFRDFAREGLVKKGDKVLIVGSEIGDISGKLQFFNDNGIDLAMFPNIEGLGLIPDGTFNFVFLLDSSDAVYADRIIKVEGVLSIQLKDVPVHIFEEPSNYKTLYFRRYDSIVAMRKMVMSDDVTVSSTKRKLCKMGPEEKMAALKGLENPLLEPPRGALGAAYLKNIKYLPELTGNTLEGYKRRVFINVDSGNDDSGVTQEWFHQNYPMMNQKFEVYHLESSSGGYVDVSDWLRKNIKEADYVVMKAEADIVEEMMKRESIHLVDELFFECKNQWGSDENKGERAYWECLSLYGRVRDERVAIHQWWL